MSIAVAIRASDAVVLRGPAYLSADLMDAGENLRFISVSGAGYDCVDIAAATQRGLPVLFYPGFSARPVAEYVIGALIICSRRLGTADAEARRPDFDSGRRTTALNGTLLQGAVLGLVGLGVGSIVQSLPVRWARRLPRMTFMRPTGQRALRKLTTSTGDRLAAIS